MGEVDKGWLGSLVKCDLCTHMWVAVYRVELDDKKLECPNCENMVHFERICAKDLIDGKTN